MQSKIKRMRHDKKQKTPCIFKLLWNLNPEQTFCFIGLERILFDFSTFFVHFISNTFILKAFFEYANEFVVMIQCRAYTHISIGFYLELSDTKFYECFKQSICTFIRGKTISLSLEFVYSDGICFELLFRFSDETAFPFP